MTSHQREKFPGREKKTKQTHPAARDLLPLDTSCLQGRVARTTGWPLGLPVPAQGSQTLPYTRALLPVMANSSLPSTFLPASVSPLGSTAASVGTWPRKSPWWKGKDRISGVLPAGWWHEACGTGAPKTGSSGGAGMHLRALIHYLECGGEETTPFTFSLLRALLLITSRSMYEKIQFFLLDEQRQLRSSMRSACPDLTAERWGDKGGWVCLVGKVEDVSFLLSLLSGMFLLCDNHLSSVLRGAAGRVVDHHPTFHPIAKLLLCCTNIAPAGKMRRADGAEAAFSWARDLLLLLRCT